MTLIGSGSWEMEETLIEGELSGSSSHSSSVQLAKHGEMCYGKSPGHEEEGDMEKLV